MAAGLHLLTLINVSNINFLQSFPVSALSSLIHDFIQLQCAKQLLQMRHTTLSKYKWFWQESVGGESLRNAGRQRRGGENKNPVPSTNASTSKALSFKMLWSEGER